MPKGLEDNTPKVRISDALARNLDRSAPLKAGLIDRLTGRRDTLGGQS